MISNAFHVRVAAPRFASSPSSGSDSPLSKGQLVEVPLYEDGGSNPRLALLLQMVQRGEAEELPTDPLSTKRLFIITSPSESN